MQAVFRKPNAILYYRTKTNPAWELLPTTVAYPDLVNVKNVVIDGDIKLQQPGVLDTQDENRLWQLCFKQGSYEKIHLDEFQCPLYKDITVTVQFDLKKAPEGYSDKAFVIPNKKRGQDGTPKVSETVKRFENVITVPPTPHSFPLARLSQNFDEDGYVGILLVFEHPHAVSKNK